MYAFLMKEKSMSCVRDIRIHKLCVRYAWALKIVKDISVTLGLEKNVYSAVGWYSINVNQILLVKGLVEFFYIFANFLTSCPIIY